MAVERERPLDPNQSLKTTYRLASRAVVRAVVGAIGVPFLALAIVGFCTPSHEPDRGRKNLFVTFILLGWLLALVRLHATGGYCTPRHAMILAFPVMAAAAQGLVLLGDRLTSRLPAAQTGDRIKQHRTVFVGFCLFACLAVWGRELLTPINQGFQGYRAAGEWLKAHTRAEARVLDLKGWATFYGQRAGYSFAELDQASRDPNLRWIVAHDALLIGPWDYCKTIRKIVASRTPVQSFPERRRPGIAQVHVFDLSQELARSETDSIPSTHR
jgi:hypothetical protein